MTRKRKPTELVHCTMPRGVGACLGDVASVVCVEYDRGARVDGKHLRRSDNLARVTCRDCRSVIAERPQLANLIANRQPAAASA